MAWKMIALGNEALCTIFLKEKQCMMYYWEYNSAIAAYCSVVLASFAENRAIKSESSHVGHP